MLLNNVGAFSRGLFSHEGPTAEQMSQASSPLKLRRLSFTPHYFEVSFLVRARQQYSVCVVVSVGNLPGCWGSCGVFRL